VKMTGRTQAEVEAVALVTKKAAARTVRDQAIVAVEWRLQRYERQVAGNLATTDSAQTYQALLTYVQDLRDWPASPGFPDQTTMPKEPA
jgi:hypothetical protein